MVVSYRLWGYMCNVKIVLCWRPWGKFVRVGLAFTAWLMPMIWLMDEWSSSLGHGSMYGFLEPQLIHHAKDRRAECEHYIQTWVKESQQEGPLAAGSTVS